MCFTQIFLGSDNQIVSNMEKQWSTAANPLDKEIYNH